MFDLGNDTRIVLIFRDTIRILEKLIEKRCPSAKAAIMSQQAKLQEKVAATLKFFNKEELYFSQKDIDEIRALDETWKATYHLIQETLNEINVNFRFDKIAETVDFCQLITLCDGKRAPQRFEIIRAIYDNLCIEIVNRSSEFTAAVEQVV